MRQREIERHRKGDVGEKRQKADKLQHIVPAVDQPDQHQAPEEAGDDVQRGEGDGLRRTAEQAADIGLGEKAAVDHHLDDEQDGEDADLEDHLTGAAQARRPFDAVALAKAFALELGFVEAAAQREQLVAAHGGLGPEIAHRLGGGLLDDGKPLFEAQRRHALVIGVQVIEVKGVRILLVGFDALDDLMLDIVQRLRLGCRPVLRAALLSLGGELHVVGDAIHIQVEKDRGCRAIRMRGLIQQPPNPRNGGLSGSGRSRHGLAVPLEPGFAAIGHMTRERGGRRHGHGTVVIMRSELR